MNFISRLIYNKSIKNQVISFMVIAVTIMTIILSLLTSSGVNQQYRQLMLKNAIQITEGLAKQVVFSILSGSEQNAQEAISQVQGFESVTAARLLLADNSTFLLSGNFPDNLPQVNINKTQTLINVETPEYWLIKAPIKIYAQQQLDETNQFELETTEKNIEIIGYAEVVYSKKHLIEAQNYVSKLISIIGIIAVVILGFILQKGLTRLFKPLEKLSSTMLLAKQTGSYLLADKKGASEILNMATAYNSMMEVLQQQESSLKSHSLQLEHEVNIRTQELIEARDSALVASQHKSEFMANVSHELRTPIQSIIGYGELVTEELELAGNFELIEDMDKIAKNSQRLLKMINSLLDLAKVEAGKMELNKTAMNLKDALSSISDTISPLAFKSDNIFTIVYQQNINHIVTDKEKLEQVLINLLGNACKFTHHGEITLTITNTADHLQFTVKDTGIGLSDEQQLFIFDEFRQVDSSQARKFNGTGLGLAISKRFVKLMGGEISVTSKLAQGATFTFTLPI